MIVNDDKIAPQPTKPKKKRRMTKARKVAMLKNLKKARAAKAKKIRRKGKQRSTLIPLSAVPRRPKKKRGAVISPELISQLFLASAKGLHEPAEVPMADPKPPTLDSVLSLLRTAVDLLNSAQTLLKLK